MRKDEEKKLEGMNNFYACHFLQERIDDVAEIIQHLDECCDTGDSNVVMGRLRGYQHLMQAETALLFKLITTRNLEVAKTTESKDEVSE
jgi:hypothetical protein